MLIEHFSLLAEQTQNAPELVRVLVDLSQVNSLDSTVLERLQTACWPPWDDFSG